MTVLKHLRVSVINSKEATAQRRNNSGSVIIPKIKIVNSHNNEILGQRDAIYQY